MNDPTTSPIYQNIFNQLDKATQDLFHEFVQESEKRKLTNK